MWVTLTSFECGKFRLQTYRGFNFSLSKLVGWPYSQAIPIKRETKKTCNDKNNNTWNFELHLPTLDPDNRGFTVLLLKVVSTFKTHDR